MITQRYFHIFYTLLLLLVFVLSGCSGMSNKYTRVEYNYQVGSTHVAVLSVTPWEEVVSNLQPNYNNFTSEEALKQSIPTTMRYDQILVDTIRANLGLSFPTASSSPTSPGKDAAADSEKKNKSETSSKSDDVTSPKATDKNSGDVPLGKIVFEGLGRDPMTKYLAATSLFQEVQLLNRYLHDAAVRRDWRAYVVRLQVSVMPKARNMPYDTYLNISFLATTYGRERQKGGICGKQQGTEKSFYSPIIVPLLVTDDIEAMTNSQSLQNIRQLDLALAVKLSHLGVQSDFARKLDNLQKVYGENFNSLLSIARVSDNTLRVRLGAMQQANSVYAMLPRTHNISVLVLVPDEQFQNCKRIYIDSLTSFVDSITGKELKNTKGDIQTDKEIKDILDDYGFKVETKTRELVKQMYWNFSVNFYDEFLKNYEDLKKYKKRKDGLDDITATDLYLSVGTVLVGSVTQYTSFELPTRSNCIPKQTVLLVDNGQKTKAFLSGDCTSCVGSIGKAYLRIVNKKTGADDIFPAEDFSFSTSSCEQVILTFPSLARMNYVSVGGKPEGVVKVHFESKEDKDDKIADNIDILKHKEENAVEFNTRYVLEKEDITKPAPTNRGGPR